ncbi:hypothetical protein [Methanoculleus bourgensis]|uniref:hypothetical protein n=1 Tax=Methanoculleus bourgensis TaxID=83986 RepID=UPI0015D3F41F|nr:hypothetical protein [Methanoculleus bourgensis]
MELEHRRCERPELEKPGGFEGGAVNSARSFSPVHSSTQPSLREEAIPEHRPNQIPVPVHD